MIRILIVDDRNLLCEILQTSLESQPDLQIVGLANNGKIAIEKAETLHPDIILMDVNMPVMDGLTATKRIVQKFPEIKVIIFSGSDEEYLDRDAIKAGAKHYLTKTANTSEIIEQIRLVYYKASTMGLEIEPTKILQQINRVQKELANHVRQVNLKFEQVEQAEATIQKYFDDLAQKNGDRSPQYKELKSTIEPVIANFERITQESKQHSAQINQIQNSLEAQLSYIHNLNRQTKKNQKYLFLACALAGVALIISAINLFLN